MPQCPVCKTAYYEAETERCSFCKWVLTPNIFLFTEQVIADFLQKEREKQNWAMMLWTKLENQAAELNRKQIQLEQLNQERAILQSQLDQALSQLKKLSQEEIKFTNEKFSHPSQTVNKSKRSNFQIVSLSSSQEEQVMSGKVNRSRNIQFYSPNCVVCSEINQRENNEDSFQILEIIPALERSPIPILAIADGMGGHTNGEDVSRETLRKVSLTLFEQLTVEPSINCFNAPSSITPETLSQILIKALEQANAHVQRMVKNNKWGNAGSTIVVTAILKHTAVVAYLGDSPMFHYQRNQQRLTKITKDHTVAGVLLRAGMITPEMAKYHEGRSRLEFYIGCPNLPKEEPVHQVELIPGDLLLLCSDGVSGSLSEEEIVKIISENNDNLELAADNLIRVSKETGETDNQTLILWRHSLPNLSNYEATENQ